MDLGHIVAALIGFSLGVVMMLWQGKKSRAKGEHKCIC